MDSSVLKFGPVTVYLGHKNGKYPDGNQVVVTGSDTKAIFDTPLSALNLSDHLQDADLAILGHVHEDHTCGLHLVPDIPLFVPEADLSAVQSVEGMLDHYGYDSPLREQMIDYIVEKFHFEPRPDAQGYGDGRVWDLGNVQVKALHMPGHTRGHSVLMVEPLGIAFLGDIDLSSFGPYYGDGCSNLAEFKETLEKIRHIEAETWITAHHKGVITDRETFLALLDKFSQRITDVESSIYDALAKQAMTLDEMVAHRFLYPKGYEEVFVNEAERNTIRHHLDFLLAEGRVIQDDAVYRSV